MSRKELLEFHRFSEMDLLERSEKWDQIKESVPRLILLDQEGTWWTPYSNKGGYGYERRKSRRLDSKKVVNLNGEEKDPELDSRAIMTSTQDGMNNPSASLMSQPQDVYHER